MFQSPKTVALGLERHDSRGYKPRSRKFQHVAGLQVSGRYRHAHSIDTVADPRWRQIGESNLSVWRELIDSLAFYPVVARGIRDAERFRAICDQAKEELLNSDAQPFVRL